MKSTIESTTLAPIEVAIANKDTARCKALYNSFLDYSQENKDDLPFMIFLFHSIESRGITVTQEIIDNIRYIASI
ncbi:MAG TPA: hypothetical protein PK079_10930 [Leptospiraceae bacterium]|nr:hypothetical protein [Leptospiraceae bacterium]HMW07450.1 hypothetical protein [Leptospiraceae bacterium]HMX32213.1 hypothetical protein [Leptospiraceae bacterium]HMY33029.1 hypothetical protein [Leptospiraceae bacterium]HMZ63513.1 hypothetical protein [Leptospiraceae bacterium]